MREKEKWIERGEKRAEVEFCVKKEEENKKLTSLWERFFADVKKRGKSWKIIRKNSQKAQFSWINKKLEWIWGGKPDKKT